MPRVHLLASLLLACHAGGTVSTTAAPGFPTLITNASQREAAVGKLVTVVGVQTRTKIPTVVGIDIDGDYALSDREVRATGRLERYVIAPPSPEEPIMATRSPGTYYSLIDPATGVLAKTSPD
jgi:hypothetical protein